MPRRANNRENARRNERANACTTVLTPVPISSGYLSENKSQSTGHHEHENRADLVSQKGGARGGNVFSAVELRIHAFHFIRTWIFEVSLSVLIFSPVLRLKRS